MSSDSESLEARYKKANDAVEKAMERRDDAIHELMEAEINYGDALEVWGELHDQIKGHDPATEAAWKRRRAMN
jgi:hypothetical protein